MTREEFREIVPSIPQQPGCYKYFDAQHELLYVGKAKNLRKRVNSYFSRTQDNYKTRKLVSLIQTIDYTVTDNEHDAFLLENSLIKHYQPRFNINLKDDKTYPYIVIKNEPYPRVFFTRKVLPDGSEYIGPFTSVRQVRELMDMIRQYIPLRTCSLNLSPAQIAKGKYKICLEFHLGNCKGPCEGLQSEEDYAENLQQVRHILKGNTGEVVKFLRKEMESLAAEYKFERAEIIRQKIASLQSYQSKSTVVNPKLGTVDVATILNEEDLAFVHFMMVNNGNVIHANSIQIEKKLDESEEKILSLALENLREKFHSQAREVIVPVRIDVAKGVKRTIPRVGDKKKLLELSQKNLQIFRDEIRRRESLMLIPDSEEQRIEALEDLQEALQLPALPERIECFDNSNFQGAYPVAAMVSFYRGLPNKKDYRHFHIRTVEGINDFASMSEIVYRRYKRLREEQRPLPQLVVIDGGKGQLSAAMASVEKLGLTGKMTVIGLAKKEESIFFPHDQEPLQLPFDSKAHLLIRRIRDEVHRFGITFHRQIRSKGTFRNELEEIKGIGTRTATELLKHFRSVKNIRNLTERELARVIGASKARIVYAYFHPDEVH